MLTAWTTNIVVSTLTSQTCKHELNVCSASGMEFHRYKLHAHTVETRPFSPLSLGPGYSATLIAISNHSDFQNDASDSDSDTTKQRTKLEAPIGPLLGGC